MFTCPRCDSLEIETLTLTELRTVDWLRCCSCAHVWCQPVQVMAPFGLADPAEKAYPARRATA
jgi:transcription elongation factor Elf1